ncbi:MAG: thiol-disulfide oxidoreductase DCC family protein [Bacteroidota bacterium]
MQITEPLSDPAPVDDAHPVVLFDGVCNLCNAAVNFIIDRDPEAVFRFAPLQSEVGQRLTARCGVGGGMETMVLVEGGRCAARSTAALRIARRLGGAWPVLSLLLAVPAPLRDAAYRLVARNRYRWFGQRDACRLPTPELQSRFLGTA